MNFNELIDFKYLRKLKTGTFLAYCECIATQRT